MASNSGFTMTLPTLDGKNYERWHIQMKVLFGYQEVLEIVQNGYQSVGEDATEAQRSTFKECKKRDYKALFMIHQCVDESNFENISGAKTTKETWDNLEKCYDGAEKVKKVKLQTLRREYELLQMKDGDTISDYFTKIRSLTNLMNGCGEVIRDQLVVEKVLRTLNPKFDHVVVAIEESKDLEVFKIEELKNSLEAHEQRIKERNSNRNSNQAFQAQSSRRFFCQGNFQKKVKCRWKNDKGRNYEGARQDSNSFTANKSNRQDQVLRRNKKKFDKKKVQCFNCKNLRNFASECRFKAAHGSGPEIEARLAQGEESEEKHVLLIVTSEKEVKDDCWYLDISCFNHMSGHKDWFERLDENAKSIVKFEDHNSINTEGVGDISIKRKDEKSASIKNVLYVPKMKNKLLSLGQLLEKGYEMTLEDKLLNVYDCDKNLILRVPLSKNRTFKIGIQVNNHKCLLSKAAHENWI
ncbi:PREDICTED: uncharacterized protein LOC109333970 [Lupinus angustifolius]|uniref:uncharacterized protein LOC109333970 n=1 Tax=Lupinus angustifolius TaxID=3871 RepID=UPI00092F33E7|nr:PREDICTED: uncharacterized protein LOC109333970 [Lupinus angustifolius]